MTAGWSHSWANTLLLQGTKLQQALMQDWEMQSNRLDCWVRQKETERMSDKKGKKEEWGKKKKTRKRQIYFKYTVYTCQNIRELELKWHLNTSLALGKQTSMKDRNTSQLVSPTVACMSWQRRTLVAVLRCKSQINQFNCQQTQLGSAEVHWSGAWSMLQQYHLQEST